MMNCQEAQEQLRVYLDGEIDKDNAGQILEHLGRCRYCFSQADFEQALRRVINKCGECRVPAAAFRERISAIIERESSE